MSLTQQFLITLTLPGAFLALLLYNWRRGNRGTASTRLWQLTLFTALVWASSILSFYGGTALPQELALGWRVAGRHALSLLSLLLLVTTAEQLDTPREKVRVMVGIPFLFWLTSVFLDPLPWPYELPSWLAGNRESSHFTLWAGIWVTSWFLPLLAASLLTRQAIAGVQSALHRNRLHYWSLTLLLFIAAGICALVQQRGQPVWQELGALGLILAAAVGTVSLAQTNLPNLSTALRHTAARLTTTLLIFGLTWVALWFFAQYMPRRSDDVNTILHLLFVAAIFTTLFMAVNRIVPGVIRHLFLPARREHVQTLAHQPDLTASLLDPDALGHFLLRLVQFNLENENGWLYLAEEGPGGTLTLHPLAGMMEKTPATTVQVAAHSPFAAYLRRAVAPLSAYEMNALPAFAEIPPAERDVLNQWQGELFMPLRAGEQLVGMVVLGEKYTGEPYTLTDFAWLQEMVAYGGPLLWQAQNLQSLCRISHYAFDQVQELALEKQQLQELLQLHERFTQLVSPNLRQPFMAMYAALQQLEATGSAASGATAVETLTRHLAQLRVMINNLILTADRVQKQRTFYVAPFHLDEAIDRVARNLSSMAEARRVTVNVRIDPQLPLINGDGQRLTEAIQYLVHNAIKFNKIGGTVEIECGPAGNELYLHVRDSGVGIPPDQLETVWQGLTSLQTERQKNSAGLGLILARFIVRAHGGRVEVRSQYGKGSTFSIYLPLLTAE